ncbi:hypothetical protein PG984_003425 [Apiospora sp. TS-2023a]
MRGSAVVTVASACLLQIASATAPKGCCRSNQCLKVIGSPLNNGVDDCSENLLVTVTALRSNAVTTTTTVTQTGVETDLFTETVTQTAATETLFSSTDMTVTAATQTNTVTETVTVPATSTDVQTATAVTTTAFNYNFGAVKARVAAITIPLDPVLALPTYAASACGSWKAYTGAAPTVTVTDSASVVGSTLSQGETQTAFVTATTETTLTVTVTETPTPATATATDTATSTTTVTVETAAPTVVVTQQCQALGRVFRPLTPYSDGRVRMLNTVTFFFRPGTEVAFQFNDPQFAPTSSWLFDSEGLFRRAGGDLVAYVDATLKASATVHVMVAAAAQVDSLVAAGTAARIQGCVDSTTGVISLRDVLYSRSNILACGDSLYLSSGDGSDYDGNACLPLTLTSS